MTTYKENLMSLHILHNLLACRERLKNPGLDKKVLGVICWCIFWMKVQDAGKTGEEGREFSEHARVFDNPRWSILAGSTGHPGSPLVVYLSTFLNTFDPSSNETHLCIWTQPARWWCWEATCVKVRYLGGILIICEGSHQGLPGVISCLRLRLD